MSDVETAQIVGITLVRNEDVFVERAVRNAIDFCDRLIIADHYSTDATFEIASRLAAEFPEKIELRRITEARESHFLINGFAGTRTWIFAVDGDEIYDPAGLAKLREELLAGQYDEWWVLFGNVLNCTAVDPAAGTAAGYLAPPCRSMTKLYNFNLITGWAGAVTHVLANGTVEFKPGYDASRRLDLHQDLSWDSSHYRCLHTCFVPRSSLDSGAATARPNVSENHRGGVTTLLRKAVNRLRGKPNVSEWKLEKYARGPLVTIDAGAFFPKGPGAARAMSGGVLEVGFVIDGLLPRWPRVWQWVRGCPSDSAVGQMRFGWMAEALREDAAASVHYSLFKPWRRYDAVIFLKSMNAVSQRLAESLRARGTRIVFDVNVDYFTPASGTFYYRGMAPTDEQTADARRMAALSHALIADSSHLATVCAQHHDCVRWIPDNVDLRQVPARRSWKIGAKLDLLWSGEAVKLFELLRIETVLRKFSSRLRLVLVTNSLTALDRWFEPWKSRFDALLADIEHTIIPFESVAALLPIYARGGIFISPRFLDNSYNWGHTEWKITLPMACGRIALGSPLPSYRDVAERSGGRGLRLCESDEDWEAALEAVLSGRIDFETEEEAARAVVESHYSTPVVAAAHAKFITEICAAHD